MRSKWPLLWLFLAFACGTVLFHTSQRVTDGRARLDALAADTGKEQESIRVLNAEWSYLNQPARLEKLAREHLALAPMKGRQFVSAAALGALQPAAGTAEKAAEKKSMAEKENPEKESPQRPAAHEAPEPARARPAPVLKPPLRAPAPPVRAAPAYSPPAAGNRGFGDLMKSLGVN